MTARLRTKVLLAFLAVSLCPIALIAYRDSEITRSALTQSAYRSLSAAASQTAIRLDTFIATTANVAVCPAVNVWFAGCVVIAGATGAGFTVNVAALLVADPAELVTTTRKVDPLSAVVVAGVV
jgi:hypothetical protein